VGSSEFGPIYRRTGHPSSCWPRHTDRVVGRRSEVPPLTARIGRRHTTAALSAVQAHRGTEGSNPFPSSEESTYPVPVNILADRNLRRVPSFSVRAPCGVGSSVSGYDPPPTTVWGSRVPTDGPDAGRVRDRGDGSHNAISFRRLA